MGTSDLTLEEYRRYGRQMLLPELGLDGQLLLKKSAVLIVGAGGLGCPCIAYLAAAGIGTLGIIDHDTIDLSNLQRQILYRDSMIDMYKAETARACALAINRNILVKSYNDAFSTTNGLALVAAYDVVVDCTDNQSVRYLISDACVRARKPLVSGSALKTEGQLAIYNFRSSPCYRCIFPEATPTHSVQSCSAAGIFGPVVGIIGSMQAMEVIKLIVQIRKEDYNSACNGRLVTYSAWDTPQFRNITLRARRANCEACGDGTSSQAPAKDTSIEERATDQRIGPKDFDSLATTHRIIDIRPRVEFGIVSFPHAQNYPIDELDSLKLVAEDKVILICKHGNDSLRIARILRVRFPEHLILDLRGGIDAYGILRPAFPRY